MKKYLSNKVLHLLFGYKNGICDARKSNPLSQIISSTNLSSYQKYRY